MKNAGASIERFFRWKGANRHFSNREYINKLGKEYSQYFSFSVVRNPWDRMVSLYFFGKQKNKSWCKKFKDFNKWIQYITQQNAKWKRYWNQFDWLKDHNDNINIDFIIRFENIDKDWLKLCKKIKCKPQQLPHINKTKKRKRKRKDYRFYYNDKSIELIGEKYKKDIEIFDYTFGENK